MTQGSVINRPASFGQHCRIGKSRSEKLSRLITSLHGPVGDGAREKLTRLGQKRQHLQLVQKTLRRLHIHEHANAACDLVERIDSQRQFHAGVGAELIDQDLGAGMALDVLEEQGGAPRGAFAVATLGDCGR